MERPQSFLEECGQVEAEVSRPLLPTQGCAEGKQTRLPVMQFAVLCFLRMLDPLNFTQIFPYMNQMMSDLRVTNDPSRIGIYSGLVVSSLC